LCRARQHLTAGFRLLFLRCCCSLLLWVGAGGALAAQVLVLHDGQTQVNAWPAVTVLADPSRQLTLADVMVQRAQFKPPTGAAGTLGLRAEALWLHIPLAIDARSDGRWVLDLGYAVLNRADVYLVIDGAPAGHWVLGNLQPRAERPLASRTPAVALDLPPGRSAALYLRVQSAGALIVPVTLSKFSVFHQDAIDEQMLQGLLTGLGLFLILYATVQWFSVREAMFWKYVLLSGGSLMFSVAQFGLGAQYLWGDHLWFELHMPGLAALLAASGTFLFVEDVLAGDGQQPRFSRVMHAGAVLLLLIALAYALDLINVHTVSFVVGTLGLAPALLGLPGAIARQRRGDNVGGYFIAAWLGYFATTWVMVGVIKGQLPATGWTLHAFQIGATLDMLVFLRVMGLRLASIHTAAHQAQQEREALRSLAHSDPLTGLPNRRGLTAQIDQRLARARPDHLLALVLLDLDGFKQVNDQHGHDTGDQLLVAVADRLRGSLREQDLIARLGGDEFVVVADGLRTPAQAEALCSHLLRAFDNPFEVGGQPMRLGLTGGYVLAPLDGRDGRELLKAADAAMYSGKQDGKHRMVRAAPAPTAPPAAQPGG